MRQTCAAPRRSTDRLGRLSRALLIAALTAAVLAWTCTAAVAQSSELHTEWTETDATHTVTREEASALTGIPAEKLSVLWSVDYSAEEYPVNVKISAPGVDGLPVYVFEYIQNAWVLLKTGTGPLVEAPVNEDGSISVVTTTVGANYPAKDTTRKAPKMGDGNWLLATVAVTVLGIAYALISTRKKAE